MAESALSEAITSNDSLDSDSVRLGVFFLSDYCASGFQRTNGRTNEQGAWKQWFLRSFYASSTAGIAGRIASIVACVCLSVYTYTPKLFSFFFFPAGTAVVCIVERRVCALPSFLGLGRRDDGRSLG